MRVRRAAKRSSKSDERAHDVNSNLPLIYALTTLVHNASRTNETRTVRGGVLVTERRSGTIAAVRELARGYAMEPCILKMTRLDTSDADPASLRKILDAAAAFDRPTIFVLDEADAVSSDLLTSMVRMIDEITEAGHAGILALGNAHGDVDAITQAVADGLGVAPVMVLGSSQFRHEMTRLDEPIAT